MTAQYPAWFTWEAKELIYKLIIEITESLALEKNDSLAKSKDLLLKILPNLCTLAEIERNKRFSLEYSTTDTPSHTLSTISTTDAALSNLTAESSEIESMQEIESLRLQLAEIIDGRRLSYFSDSPIDDADYVTTNDLLDSGLLEESSILPNIPETQKSSTAPTSELSIAVYRIGDLLVRIFDSLERRDLFGVMTTLKLSSTNHKMLMDLIVCRINTQFDELPLELILQTLHLSSQFFGLNVLSLLYRLRNQYQARLESGQFTTDQLINTFALVSKHKLVNFDGFIFELIERLTNAVVMDKLSRFRLPYVAYLLAKSPYAKTKHFMSYVQQHEKHPVGNVKFLLRGLAIRGEFLSQADLQTTLRVIHAGFDWSWERDTTSTGQVRPERDQTEPRAEQPGEQSQGQREERGEDKATAGSGPRVLPSAADRAVLCEVSKLLLSGNGAGEQKTEEAHLEGPAHVGAAGVQRWRDLLAQMSAGI